MSNADGLGLILDPTRKKLTDVRMSWANLTPASQKYVDNVLDRGWLSYSLYMPRLEREVAAIHRAKRGVLVNSGTDALTISLAVLREESGWSSNSEVIVPAVTFVATVNAVIRNGLKPVFADVDPSTCNVTAETIARRIGRRTVAIIPVHLFGLPVDMPAVIALAKERNLKVIEDSCETFGVHPVVGDMAAFSFYMSHHIATGVGGMILTNSKTREKIARSYQNHGRIDDGSHFKFGRVGYSSRITELEAALGVAALEHWREDLSHRWTLARHYTFGLQDLCEIRKPPMPVNHSWMFYPIKLKKGNLDKLLKHLKRSGIESREAMPLINQPVFKALYEQGSCPTAEDWTKNGLLLPLHPKMTEKDVYVVCGKLKDFFCRKR